jgi:dihydrofolate reductase
VTDAGASRSCDRRLVVTYYAALSLDGRIAGEEHDLAFLKTLTGAENDYEVFYADVDSLIMGAGTWEFMVRHGSWPYAGKPTWIVTHAAELAELPGAEPVEIFAGEIGELVRLIESRGLKRTWLVGGGDIAGQLLAHDLIDELILTLAPALVGRGPALADGEFPLRRFDLTRLERFGDDGVRLHYDRSREES